MEEAGKGLRDWDFAELQGVTINAMKSAFIPYPEWLEDHRCGHQATGICQGLFCFMIDFTDPHFVADPDPALKGLRAEAPGPHGMRVCRRFWRLVTPCCQ